MFKKLNLIKLQNQTIKIEAHIVFVMNSILCIG